ncbi:MAG: hypothetical protein ACAH88_13600 [Roseimicrobium sp.]
MMTCAMAVWFAGSAALLAQKVVVNRPEFGAYLGLWRISHDPVVDDHANYHQQQCWSPDGRYLTYRHCPMIANPQSGQPYAGYSRPSVRLYDFSSNEDRELGMGIVSLGGSCWANNRNWLFYLQTRDADHGFPAKEGAPVVWVDLERSKTTTIGSGFELLGGVDFKDEWIYGGIKDTTRQPNFRVARLRVTSSESKLEELKEATGTQWITNPRHPMFFTRHDQWGQPFSPTVLWWNLDGSNRRPGMLVLEAAHMAWQGNGEHFLIGDGVARGRRWDEPAPSNVHILAAGNVGNLSAGDRNGRFAVGDSAMFDLRNGDTWQYKYFLSPHLQPTSQFYASFDGEAKGSPDGTKVAFTGRYDMEKGPVTELTELIRAGSQALRVKSTAGFPEKGAVVVWTEVIGYERKTPDGFEGLTRGLHGTRVSDGTPSGRAVTDFTHHILTDDQWKNVTAVGNDVRLGIQDINSPLLRQRNRDVYVAVVRRPDRPTLQADGATVRLIPGESHYENAGYHLVLDGRRITTRLLRPGETVPLKSPGQYSAVAVEWSGSESEPGNAVSVTAATQMQVLAEPPQDFRWTRERWMAGGKEASADAVASMDEAVCETLHRYDGVITRRWHKKGIITQHHDLNHEGKAIRRLTYEGGKLALRDYYNRENEHTSRQIFAPDGSITETIHFGNRSGQEFEVDHWWFDRGTPIRRVVSGSQFTKEGEQWGNNPL